MPRKAQPGTEVVGFRIERDVLTRADEVGVKLAAATARDLGVPASRIKPQSRAEVLRLAISIGLDALDARGAR